jgi:hypothetical protein
MLRIDISGVGNAPTRLVRVSASELVVDSRRPLQQWALKDGGAHIPAASVEGLRVTGLQGRRTMGALVGLGAGAGLVAATLASQEELDGGALVAIPVIALLGTVGGYFVGRTFDESHPYYLFAEEGDGECAGQSPASGSDRPPFPSIGGPAEFRPAVTGV